MRRGLRLTEPLDIVVGETGVVLHRHSVLAGVMNNVVADALHNTPELATKSAPGRDWADLGAAQRVPACQPAHIFTMADAQAK